MESSVKATLEKTTAGKETVRLYNNLEMTCIEDDDSMSDAETMPIIEPLETQSQPSSRTSGSFKDIGTGQVRSRSNAPTTAELRIRIAALTSHVLKALSKTKEAEALRDQPKSEESYRR